MIDSLLKEHGFTHAIKKKKSFCTVQWSKIMSVFGGVIISTCWKNITTYFSPASVVPPWTRSWITVLWLWGFGVCVTVAGTLSIFILADHNSVLNTTSTTARALTRIKHTNYRFHIMKLHGKQQQQQYFDSNSNSPH